MERILNFLPILSLIVGGWALVNGILHDVAVFFQGRKYDRDTLRLFMDGHILITCGAIQVLAYWGLKQNQSWGIYAGIITSLSLLTYCAMIFPFLKSFGTITINLSYLILLLLLLFLKK